MRSEAVFADIFVAGMAETAGRAGGLSKGYIYGYLRTVLSSAPITRSLRIGRLVSAVAVVGNFIMFSIIGYLKSEFL